MKTRKMRGITLISLIVTIIILLILAGISIQLIGGSNGILNRASSALDANDKATATEKMELKITYLNMVSYGENTRKATLQELADGLCADEEMQYVLLESQKTASLAPIEVGEAKSIFTKLKKYPYEFEIDENLQLASVDGVKVATTNPENEELKQTIEEMKKTIDELSNKIANIDNTTSEDTTPAGTVISYITGKTAPGGYLICDGSVYNISDYPKLAQSIYDGFGKYNYFGGNGSTTFAVPDLRGEFLRGTGTNSHAYSGSGADVGLHQGATLSPHVFTDAPNITVTGSVADPDWMGEYSSSDVYKYVGAATANFPKNRYSSRPTNTSVLYCIKY